MPMPYRFQPVPTFEHSRLRLTPAGEETVAPLLLELQTRPLLLDPHVSTCLSRTFRIVFRRLRGTPYWCAMVFDIPRPGIVRPVLVRDDVTSREAFIVQLEGSIVRAARESIRAMQT